MVTLTPHWFVPPHTPQLSTPLGSLQHTLLAAIGARQQVPKRSRTSPTPLHMPHPSSRPPTQHLPSTSTTSPGAQHTPVTESISAQHWSLMSTLSPLGQTGASVRGVAMATTLQSAPVQPGLHVHMCVVVLHTLC